MNQLFNRINDRFRIGMVFLPFIFMTFMLQGWCNNTEGSGTVTSKQTEIRDTLEAKVGYFFFTDSKMRKVYNNGGWDAEVSGTFPIWKWLKGYAGIEYLEKSGRSLNGGQKTSLWMLPISVGIQPTAKVSSNVDFYATFGGQYFYLHTHNQSSYVDRHDHHNGGGGFLNTGFHFFPLEHMVIDLFGAYAFRWVHVEPSKHEVYSRKVQLSGLTFGLGLGYAF